MEAGTRTNKIRVPAKAGAVVTDTEASNTVTYIGLVDRVHYGRRKNVPGIDYHQQHIENTVVLRPWKTEGAATVQYDELWLTCSGPSKEASRLTPRSLCIERLQCSQSGERLEVIGHLQTTEETDEFTSLMTTASPTEVEANAGVPDVVRQPPLDLGDLGTAYPSYYPTSESMGSPLRYYFADHYVLEEFASRAIPGDVQGIKFGVDRLRENDKSLDLVLSAIRNFGSPPETLRNELADGAWHHFGLMNERADYGWKHGEAPTGPDEIWNYVSIQKDSLEATVRDGKPYVLIHTYPVWEEEHGMVFVLEDGTRLVGFNSHGDGTSVLDDWKWPPPGS